MDRKEMNDEVVTDRPDIPANDLILAKEMADTLHRHYPGHMWAVNVQGEQGVADIRNMALSGEYGYRLRLVTNYSMSEFLERVKRAGGEILERYRLPRGRADFDQLMNLPRGRLGAIIGEHQR